MPKKKEQENTIDSIQKAKIVVRDKVGKLFHDAKQSHRQYSYTSHTAVTAAVVPAMHETGMTYKFTCNDLQIDNGFAIMKMCVEFHWGGIEFDASHGTHYETVTLYCGDKLRDGTSMGAITSYGLKVALLKYFGLESGEKDLEDIQADQDERARMKEQRQQTVNKTVEIFDGEELASSTTMKDFLRLCNDCGVTSNQINKKMADTGYKDLDDVPDGLMQSWCTAMDAKLAQQDEEAFKEKLNG